MSTIGSVVGRGWHLHTLGLTGRFGVVQKPKNNQAAGSRVCDPCRKVERDRAEEKDYRRLLEEQGK